ncbi:MAG TPA: hypothetical protein VFV48_05055 [Pseudomonadales bacterium]|nr:hypothetical protein [Pseudomonadales bacterium]
MKHTAHYLIYGLLLVFLLTGCEKEEEHYKQIVLGGFSPDGNKLALSYCTTRSICKTGLFDINQKKFDEITPQNPDRFYIPGGFSPDGSLLALTVRRNSDQGKTTQVAVFELATKKLTEITHSEGRRASPSFSHDGKKILHTQSNRERTSGQTRFADWDVYETQWRDSKERRLTAFKFFMILSSSYLPGDEKFIFSGDSPHAYVSPTGKKGYKAYRDKFHENEIFILTSAGPQHLEPIFIREDFSSSPVISQDGSQLVYVAMSQHLDNVKTRFTYDLFLFDGQQHQRLTKLNSWISDVSMSFNG